MNKKGLRAVTGRGRLLGTEGERELWYIEHENDWTEEDEEKSIKEYEEAYRKMKWGEEE